MSRIICFVCNSPFMRTNKNQRQCLNCRSDMYNRLNRVFRQRHPGYFKKYYMAPNGSGPSE